MGWRWSFSRVFSFVKGWFCWLTSLLWDHMINKWDEDHWMRWRSSHSHRDFPASWGFLGSWVGSAPIRSDAPGQKKPPRLPRFVAMGFAQDLGSGGSLSRPGKRLQFAKVFKWPVGEFVDWTIEPSKNGEMFRRLWYVYYVYQRANHSKSPLIPHWKPHINSTNLETSPANGPLMTLGVTLCSHIRRSRALIGGKKTRNSPSKHQNWSKKKMFNSTRFIWIKENKRKWLNVEVLVEILWFKTSTSTRCGYGIVWVNDDTW